MSAGRMGGCCGGGNPRAWGWPVGAAPSVRLAWWCTRGQKAALAEILHTRGGEAVLFSGKSWPSWLAIVPCVFVPVELAAMARRARGAAVSGRPSLSDRDGRGAIVRVASAVRRWGRRPKYCHGSVMLDVDVCAGISNGLWPRGAALPMVYCLAAHDQHEAGRHVASYADAFSVTSSLHCWHWAFFSAVPSTRHK